MKHKNNLLYIVLVLPWYIPGIMVTWLICWVFSYFCMVKEFDFNLKASIKDAINGRHDDFDTKHSISEVIERRDSPEYR